MSHQKLFIDNLRIVDVAESAGDFLGDGGVEGADLASWRYAFGLHRHGDADKYGMTTRRILWRGTAACPASAETEETSNRRKRFRAL